MFIDFITTHLGLLYELSGVFLALCGLILVGITMAVATHTLLI